MVFANMHNHSLFSDGRFSPEEIATLAKREGYGAVVLTDHDTVRGTYFMQKAARKAGLLTLLGCEFSALGLGTDFHLLGYDFNVDEPEMKALLERISHRLVTKTQLLFQWAVEAGVIKGMDWEEVPKAFPLNNYYCNEQIFNILMQKGLKTKEDYPEFAVAFGYTPEKEKRITEIIGIKQPDIEEVIRIIRKAGGVPVIAHPHGKLQYIEPLIEMGIMGIEVNFPSATKEESRILNEIADERGLYKTGGTDHSGILGGCLEDGEEYNCDPMLCGADEEAFMKLYKRILG